MEEMVTIQFQISKKGLETLRKINEAGSAEFRDTLHKSLQDFLASNDFVGGFMTEEQFKKRNFCDYQDLDELQAYGLIDSDAISWHPTYLLTKFGKQILEMNKDK